jgi:hypothetical protein
VLQFQVDYISASASYPAGYGTLGVTGGEGDVSVGDAASVLEATTSLTENLNKAPFLSNLAQYTVNSPSLADPNSGLWEYRMIYSVVVDQAAFDPSGFGGFTIVDQHNSPSKMAKFTPEPCGGCVTNIALASADAGGSNLLSLASAVVCSTNPPPPSGLCPHKYDFWKKHLNDWPAAYSPNQTVQSVFAKASLFKNTGTKTLEDAVDGKAGSGKVKDLLRQAVAALLNAGSPGIAYPFTTTDIVTGVDMALMDGGDQVLKSLTELLKEANENKDCRGDGGSEDNCDTAGRPNVLALRYTGQSCAAAINSQMAISGKTSCNGDPQGAAQVRVVAGNSSSPPGAGATVFFDGLVSLGSTFEVKAAAAGDDRFGANTYFFIYDGATLVQSIQIHTSCSAPLRRGESFGSLVLEDYRIEP